MQAILYLLTLIVTFWIFSGHRDLEL